MRNANSWIPALVCMFIVCGCASAPVQKAEEPAAPAARVFFVSPQDGATVKGRFDVKFGLEGMTIAPAGEMKEGTGHHHLFIDAAPLAKGTVIPADEQHLHFGKGQTETKLKLPRGKHRLTLQFADGAHMSYGEAMSATIEVTVK